jgi:hypothetical protein
MNSHDVQDALAGLTAVQPKLEQIKLADARLGEVDRSARRCRGPLPKVENVDLVVAWVRTLREAFEQGIGDSPSVLRSVLVPLSEGRRPYISDREVLLVLFWLLGPVIEANAADAVGRLEYREGLSSAERRQMSVRIAVERAELLRDRERLVDEVIDETGGTLQLRHLPETEQRRGLEASRARREAEISARQRDTIEAIDRRHAASEGESQYLATSALRW